MCDKIKWYYSNQIDWKPSLKVNFGNLTTVIDDLLIIILESSVEVDKDVEEEENVNDVT